MPPPNKTRWHGDCFELEETESQWMQEVLHVLLKCFNAGHAVPFEKGAPQYPEELRDSYGHSWGVNIKLSLHLETLVKYPLSLISSPCIF